MYRFAYRRPRFSVDLSAQFLSANETLNGRCTDIGTNGIRIELPHSVLLGNYGTLSLRHHDQTIHLKVRVAHTGPEHSGLEFVFDSAVERNTVAHLVASLSTCPSRPVMSLVQKINVSLGDPTTQN